jgi:hypothetical protein
MTRIRIPEGEGSERERIYALRPVHGAALNTLQTAVYDHATLPHRVAELCRFRVAIANDCPV